MMKVRALLDKEVKECDFEEIKSQNVVWADFVDPTHEELQKVAEVVGLEVSDIKDFLDEHARPLVSNLEKYSLIVFSAPLKEESTKPIVVFISKSTNDLITVREGESRSIERLNSRDMKKKVAMFEKGPTYILFRIMDEVLATYNHVLEDIDEDLEKIEDVIYGERPSKEKRLMVEMYELKKTLIFFQKGLSGNREVIASIEKEYGEFLNKKDLSKFRLLYSDLTRLIDLTSTYRDILTTSLEVHLSTISNNLNITMKQLSAWAALILVPSLIAGIYGMNFQYIPKASWHNGFYIALGIMATAVMILYFYFKRKDWI